MFRNFVQKFKRSRKDENDNNTNEVEEANTDFNAKVAKNLAVLSNSSLSLKAAETTKVEIPNLINGLKKLASEGRLQARVLILIPDYLDELYKQSPLIKSEIQSITTRRVQDVSDTSNQIKRELELLGFNITVRAINLQIRRVAGDTGNFFVGHDILISWG